MQQDHSDIKNLLKPYVCKICQKRFSAPSRLKRHMSVHSNQGSYTCPTCSKGFNNKHDLLSHSRFHGDRKFACSQCDKIFIKNEDLIRHVRLHTGIRPYYCESCDKGYNELSNYNRHMRSSVHTDDKLYTCCVCIKDFALLGNLKSHLKTHRFELPYTCSPCKKIFSESETLWKHLYDHVRKPYLCTLCTNVQFKTTEEYDFHIKMCHTKQADGVQASEDAKKDELMINTSVDVEAVEFKCCNIQFANRRRLNKHLRLLHSKEISSNDVTSTSEEALKVEDCLNNSNSESIKEKKPKQDAANGKRAKYSKQNDTNLTRTKESYKCALCTDQLFSKATKLKKHLLNVHLGSKPYLCAQCYKRFFSLVKLKAHSKLHIKKPYNLVQCNICCKRFQKVEDLRADFKKHFGLPYRCRSCSTCFPKIKKLTNHLRRNENEHHQNKKKPVACNICEEHFKIADDLKNHVLEEHFGERTYICRPCQLHFANASDLHSHVQSSHDKEFACNLCRKTFGPYTDVLKSHMRKHIGDSPFSCSKCNYRIDDIKLLKIHVKGEH